jgi:D-sedoheptulose 7-phosphate isomerase
MNFYESYTQLLHEQLTSIDVSLIDELAEDIFSTWKRRGRVFLCGNGGSAANALHIANDFSYGVNPNERALDVEALTGNSAVITCLANDAGYTNIFSLQLRSKAKESDLLIVLSGSGNSPNVIAAINEAKNKGMKVYGIFGFSGGEAKEIVDIAIHTPIDDMQLAEDIQLIIGHWLMRTVKQKIQRCSDE